MTEETETRKEIVKGKSNEGFPIPVLTLIIGIVLVSCSVLYVNTAADVEPETYPSVKTEEKTEDLIASGVLPKNTSAKKVRIKPICTKQEHISQTLREISSELFLKKGLCTPEDVYNVKKHAIPNIKKAAEPRAPFIVYFAVGLLMASVVAAFLDVYTVKGKPSKRKPPLNKRCSLADLTVLRHNRRESMKKDSIADDHRVPLKLLGSRPVPDARRSSVPIYTGEIAYGNVSPRQTSRKCSLDYNEPHSNEYCHNRARLMRRF